MNLANTMIETGKKYPEYPAVARGVEVFCNYSELASRVSRIASALRSEFNLTAGDRVALALGNCPEYLELLYAVWHAGLVVVPINAKLHKNEFQFILQNSGASMCFVDAKLGQVISRELAPELEVVVEVASEAYQQMLRCPPCEPATCGADASAWLFYTSGTTGQPKGAVLSHRNLITMCECYFADVDPTAPWKAILHAAPMSHGSGLYGLAYVMCGGCHIIPESGGFAAQEIYSLIEYWPGLAFFAAPTMVKRLLDYKTDSSTDNLKIIIYGGGPMYVADSLAALERFGPKLTQLYGQGESPMTITALNSKCHADSNHPRFLERLASVGVAQSAVSVRVADAEDAPLPIGEVGEIQVRGDSVMSGYWQNEEATQKTLANGWLHTGDYGVFDEDGFLTLKDRAKDLIISGGTNIYPREVEEVLLKHIHVAEVAVIGREDREWGEAVIAFVVAEKGKTVDRELLDAWCLEEMARFKRPKHYWFVDTLPKNNYGKVVKTRLRKLDGEMKL